MIERLALLVVALLLTAAIVGALYLGAWLLERRRARHEPPPEWTGPRPPEHFNCRCTIVPIEEERR